jgi:hypothetical protein
MGQHYTGGRPPGQFLFAASENGQVSLSLFDLASDAARADPLPGRSAGGLSCRKPPGVTCPDALLDLP